MARTRPTTKTTAKSEADTSTTEATEEATVTETTEATPVAADEATTEATTTEATTEATAEAEPDLDTLLQGFNAAVTKALDEKDASTGTLSVEAVEAVKAEYQKLDKVKAKNAAKKGLQDLLRTAIAARDVAQATAVMTLSDEACVAGGKASGGGTEKVPADPAQAYVDRLVALNLAYSLAVNDVPEKVDAEAARTKAAETVQALAEQAESLYTWTKADHETRGDEPEVNPVVKRAVRLAQGKVSGGRTSSGGGSTKTGPKGNTAEHIKEFFADKPVGHKAKIAEIAKFKSSQYPDGDASPGALTSRMQSKNPIEGFGASDIDGVFAIEKTAA